ncbi:MGMT family protein [Candidatus Gottesmanbacteria bacterium]|nr:MGMT family protein [Candidatus Gottesmanbacteria bacterium]
MTTDTLTNRTYRLLRRVPKGKVTTYKALANALHTKAYRAIGQIMKSNPYAPEVPCHRVVASDGTIGGFMGKTKGAAIQKKIAMLQKEGVNIRRNKIQEFSSVYWSDW